MITYTVGSIDLSRCWCSLKDTSFVEFINTILYLLKEQSKHSAKLKHRYWRQTMYELKLNCTSLLVCVVDISLFASFKR